MRTQGLVRPNRAAFPSPSITSWKDKVRFWRLGAGELLPRVAAQAVDRETMFAELLQREMADDADRRAACAACLKSPGVEADVIRS